MYYHPINCSCHCLDLASCPLCVVCTIAKVCDLYLPSCFVQQNVVRLDVPMKDILLVHVIQPFQNLFIGWKMDNYYMWKNIVGNMKWILTSKDLLHNGCYVLLVQDQVFCYIIEWPSIKKLHHYIKNVPSTIILRLQKGFFEVDQIFMLQILQHL